MSEFQETMINNIQSCNWKTRTCGQTIVEDLMPFCKHSESIQQAPKKNAFINELIGYRETCKQVVLKIRVSCLILFQTYDSYEMIIRDWFVWRWCSMAKSLVRTPESLEIQSHAIPVWLGLLITFETSAMISTCDPICHIGESFHWVSSW